MFKILSVSTILVVLMAPQFLLGQIPQSTVLGPYTLNERSARQAVRTLHGAEATYQATTGNGNFGSLAAMLKAQLIDAELASGTKFGYVFVVSVVPFVPGESPAEMTVTATPRVYRKHGRKSFFIATDGVIRGGDKFGQEATAGDPIIDECTNGALPDNERCTIQDLNSLHTAQLNYAATTGNGNFGSFTELYQAGLIRSDLADYDSRGYFYTVLWLNGLPGVNKASFKIWATPSSYGTTGIRSFFIATDGVLRGADKQGQLANENDPPISN